MPDTGSLPKDSFLLNRDLDVERSRRRFLLACGLGILASMPILVWMITFGRWNLIQSGFLSDFYDAQARALFHGHWNVPASVVQIEGFVVKGRTYMYFGPFPALIRMPVLLVTSRLDGRLTDLSIMLAMLVALICTSRLAWKIRNLVSSASVSVKESVLVAFSVIVVATGSVFVFLANTAIVYHEAEAWGAALAIAAFDAMVGFLQHPYASRRGNDRRARDPRSAARGGRLASARWRRSASWLLCTGRCPLCIGARSIEEYLGASASPPWKKVRDRADLFGSASRTPGHLGRVPLRC